MIPLRAKGFPIGLNKTIVAALSHDPFEPDKILLWDTQRPVPSGTCSKAIISPDKYVHLDSGPIPQITALNQWGHLVPGDIAAVHQSGLVETLFRIDSPHNSLFITDRCNSNCLMCSQPPRNKNDLDELFQLNARLIPLIPKEIKELGITGGEPTLLGKRLLHLIHQLKEALPDTDIHMLTNGRAFAWPKVANAFAEIGHPGLMFGVPLYSDYPPQHDYIVQTRDAFHQTVQGLHNLARSRQLLEIRVVLQQQSIPRLAKLAEFIYLNFPFVAHVAFMGLEYTGYVPHNHHLLYVEPERFRDQLEAAVTYLHDMGLCVSIYNLPLCLVHERLWDFCRKSISDWKQGYLQQCEGCSVKEQCGGVFETSRRYSPHITAIPC